MTEEYPIWWGTCPRIIDTFMESYDFTGKTVIPFCTSGSSGIGTSESHIRSSLPSAEVSGGHRMAVESDASEDELQFLEELYVPHPLAGVMAQNRKSDASKKHVWTTSAQKILGGGK